METSTKSESRDAGASGSRHGKARESMYTQNTTDQDSPSTKRCSKCGETKPLSEYFKSKTGRDGLRADCKECYRLSHQESKKRRMERTGIAPKEKECKACGEVKPISEYCRNSLGKDGYFAACKQCVYRRNVEWRKSPDGRAWVKKYRENHPRHGPHSGQEYMREYRKKYRERNQDKVAAGKAVGRAIKRGKIPHPATVSCKECGEQAREYHHHLGYEREHWLDVIALCRKCHISTR